MRRAALLAAVAAVAAAVLAAPLAAPRNPFDTASLDLMDALTPPVFAAGGGWRHLFGTDAQGRDVLSAILYGGRLSFAVGALAVALALAVGVPAGLVAGYAGGWLDAGLMRLADAQLAVPAMLLALLADGCARALLPRPQWPAAALPVLVVSIGLARWPQFARVVRGAARLERQRDYVSAARLFGVSAPRIALTHVLPNALAPVAVLATLSLGLAVLDEATLSFLGVGLPATTPSLGTLIRLGADDMLSGSWWVLVFPALALALPVLALNLAADRALDGARR
jgi:peptide/nickel transport system permease protein